MRNWVRRVRGAVRMGLTWAAGWTPIGGIIGLVLGSTLGPPNGVIAAALVNAAVFGALGFVGGTIFSTVIRLAEGRRRFDELSLPRFIGWGAVGGLILGVLAVVAGLWGPGLQAVDGVIMVVSVSLGAGSAGGSLALARQADDRELLAASADLEDAGLTAEEIDHLLAGSG